MSLEPNKIKFPMLKTAGDDFSEIGIDYRTVFFSISLHAFSLAVSSTSGHPR